MPNALSWLRRSLALAAFTAILPAHATPFQIVIDTSSLTGTSVELALDLVDGGGPANTVVISGFATDGTLGASGATGDVTGTLPGHVTLGDSSFFTEYLQTLVLGKFLLFSVDTSGSPPDASSFPDAFSAFLLDPTTGLPLFPTSDPTGADALFLLNIGVQALPDVYWPNVRAGPVPEPNPLLLLTAALLSFAALRARGLPRNEPMRGPPQRSRVPAAP